MINVIVAGAAGRMGSRLIALAKESSVLGLAGAIEGKGHPALGLDAGETAGVGKMGVLITNDLLGQLDRAEVVIDFSAPEATLGHLRAVAERRRAMVIGTTGFDAAQLDELNSLTRQVPCVFSPNMSVGVTLIYKVIRFTPTLKLGENTQGTCRVNELSSSNWAASNPVVPITIARRRSATARRCPNVASGAEKSMTTSARSS